MQVILYPCYLYGNQLADDFSNISADRFLLSCKNTKKYKIWKHREERERRMNTL